MRVPVDIDEIEIDTPEGLRDGVCATCQRCGHETESFGTSERSVKRCLALLRTECPEGEQNFYVNAEEYEED